MDLHEVKSLLEDQLNTQQISNLFSRAERMANTDIMGSNRSTIGQLKDKVMGKDHDSLMRDAIADIETNAASTRPVPGIAAKFDEEFVKLKSTTGNDSAYDIYKNFFNQSMISDTQLQSLIYNSLVAANGMAASGTNKGAIIGYFKLVSDAVKGQISSFNGRRPIPEGMFDKITRDKLIKQWIAAGSPNNTKKIAEILITSGMRQDQIEELYLGLGITDPAAAVPQTSKAPSGTSSAPNRTPQGPVVKTAPQGAPKSSAIPPIRNANDVEVALGTLLMQANNFSDADKDRLATFIRTKADELEGKTP